MESEEVCNTSHPRSKYFKMIWAQNTSFLDQNRQHLVRLKKPSQIGDWPTDREQSRLSLEITENSLEPWSSPSRGLKSGPSQGRRTEHGFPSPRAAPRGSPGDNTFEGEKNLMEYIFGKIWKGKASKKRWLMEKTSSPGGWYPSPSLRNTPTFTKKLHSSLNIFHPLYSNCHHHVKTNPHSHLNKWSHSPSTPSSSPCQDGQESVGIVVSVGSVQAKRRLSCCPPDDVVVIVFVSRHHICRRRHIC